MVWIILAIIFTIIVLLLNLYVKIHMKYLNDELYVVIKLLFLKYTLVPEREKAEVKIKKKPKQVKTSAKKKKKASKFDDITELISIIKSVSEKILYYFDKYLRIDVKALRIKVAADDAASAAILYGLVSQGVSFVLEILREKVKKVKIKRDDSVLVVTDFTSEEFETQVDIVFKIKIWQGIILGVSTFSDFIINFNI